MACRTPREDVHAHKGFPQQAALTVSQQLHQQRDLFPKQDPLRRFPEGFGSTDFCRCLQEALLPAQSPAPG